VTEAWAFIEDGVLVEAHDAGKLVPWWSFTKTILAAAALVLVRDGLAELDEPIQGRPYTLRHLLQHRAGLAEYGGYAAYHEAVARGDEPWSVPDLLARVEADRLRYSPSEGWDYSNIGYLFVRRMIEEITGESLDRALRRLVFCPLGIGSARVAATPDDLAPVTMGSASSYHPAWVYHGLVVGSPEDAAMLLHRLMTGMVLPPESLRAMLDPYRLPGPIPDRPWRKPGYGLGVMTGEATGVLRVAGHTGGGPGSTIAVYHRLGAGHSRCTAACFATGEDQAAVEERSFELLK
jgi:CubicO group peptidase (beta-lactamase class C family)